MEIRLCAIPNRATDQGAVIYDSNNTYDSNGFDPVGNRQTRTASGAFTGVGIENVSGIKFDKNDRVDNDNNASTPSTYFDANGNTIKPDLDGNGVVDSAENLYVYDYDLENRLIEVNDGAGMTITLIYDGDGNRVSKAVDAPGTANDSTTQYLVDDRNLTGYAQVLEERDGADNTLVSYVYGLDLVSQTRNTGTVGSPVWTVRYYGYDGLGSVRYLTDGTYVDDGFGGLTEGPDFGEVTDTYTYDAFGIKIASSESTLNNYRYTGEQWDDDLKLYYLRARYYKPELGRFWSMDTFEGKNTDPVSLHKYLYANANPLNMIDPSGHESLISVSIGSTISQSLEAIYNGVVSAVGDALQATIFGVQAGKGMNEIMTDYVLDQTGLSLIVNGYEAVKGYFQDEESADIVAYEMWREEVIAAVAMSLADGDEGDFEIEFVPQCFTAGTLVATEDGPVPIEAIRRGDKVWAWDEDYEHIVLRSVANTFVHRRHEIVKISVGGETLEMTGEHPFFVRGEGWKSARKISPGDELVGFNGENLPVESTEILAGEFVVYNFEVEIDHNYFVGSQGVLTHNVSAAALGRKLGIRKNPFLAAHHIVSRFGGGRAGQRARDVLLEVGISIENRVNGVGLPKNLKAHASLVAKGSKWATAATHSKVHTGAYYTKLASELEQAKALGGQRGVYLKLQEIGDRLKLGARHPLGAF